MLSIEAAPAVASPALWAALAIVVLASATPASAQPAGAGGPGLPAQAGNAEATNSSALTQPVVPLFEPAAAASRFAPRSVVDCADFRAGPGATWRALASVRIPGPQGPILILAGQTFAPGAYVSGLDLAGILQARCF